MSKIYEALLRAEQERAASGSASPVALEDAPTPVYTAPTPLASPVAELPEPPFTAPGIDFDAIRRERWSPTFKSLPALQERGSAVEQFRSLRSRMQEYRDLNTLKSVLISSGMPREGKSFVTANLAVSFARHKANRVLLIDGDMRRSTLHKVFGAPNQIGLTEYLSGQCSLQQILQQPAPTADGTLIPGLSSLTFVSGGADHENAADLSGNPRFEQLLAAVTPHFDWVVVDSSPVNLVADGVNLARVCDGVLLVARGGVTKFESAQRALNELKAARVLGFILNAVDHPSDAGGYYGYEGYDRIEP